MGRKKTPKQKPRTKRTTKKSAAKPPRIEMPSRGAHEKLLTIQMDVSQLSDRELARYVSYLEDRATDESMTMENNTKVPTDISFGLRTVKYVTAEDGTPMIDALDDAPYTDHKS